jgi:hypothetical protein
LGLGPTAISWALGSSTHRQNSPFSGRSRDQSASSRSASEVLVLAFRLITSSTARGCCSAAKAHGGLLFQVVCGMGSQILDLEDRPRTHTTPLTHGGIPQRSVQLDRVETDAPEGEAGCSSVTRFWPMFCQPGKGISALRGTPACAAPHTMVRGTKAARFLQSSGLVSASGAGASFGTFRRYVPRTQSPFDRPTSYLCQP